MRICCLILIILGISTEGWSQKYLLNQDVNKDTVIPKVGYRRLIDFSNYSAFGVIAGPHTGNPVSKIKYLNSWQFREGIWLRVKLTRWYAIGAYGEYAREGYRLKTSPISDTINIQKTLWAKQVNNNMVVGVFNRFNIRKDKIFFDLGAYYAYDILPRVLVKSKPVNDDFEYKKTTYNRPGFMNRYNYGLDFRFTHGPLSVYGRYRITGLYKKQDYDLPKFMFGVAVDYLN